MPAREVPPATPDVIVLPDAIPDTFRTGDTGSMAIDGVTRELLVRYLDTWAPAAGRRATFVCANPPPETAEAAVRAIAEFADRPAGRRLTVAVIAPQPPDLSAVLAELRPPAALAVHPISGDGDALLPAALRAAGSAGAPVLVYLEIADPETGTVEGGTVGAGTVEGGTVEGGTVRRGADGPGVLPLRAIRTGKPAELLLVAPPGAWPAVRADLLAAGFTLTAGVELVEDDRARLVAFATSAGKSLEAFKSALWEVDEYAGVRYRDPGDPDGHLIDISLHPHPGPLRRELLAVLDAGPRTIAELRRFTLTDTVYRAADTGPVLTALLAAGVVTRDPEHGRLGGDVVIARVVSRP